MTSRTVFSSILRTQSLLSLKISGTLAAQGKICRNPAGISSPMGKLEGDVTPVPTTARVICSCHSVLKTPLLPAGLSPGPAAGCCPHLQFSWPWTVQIQERSQGCPLHQRDLHKGQAGAVTPQVRLSWSPLWPFLISKEAQRAGTTLIAGV